MMGMGETSRPSHPSGSLHTRTRTSAGTCTDHSALQPVYTYLGTLFPRGSLSADTEKIESKGMCGPATDTSRHIFFFGCPPLRETCMRLHAHDACLIASHVFRGGILFPTLCNVHDGSGVC